MTLAYEYAYDSQGNIVTYSALGKGTFIYSYDALDQFLSVVGDQTYGYIFYSGTGVKMFVKSNLT